MLPDIDIVEILYPYIRLIWMPYHSVYNNRNTFSFAQMSLLWYQDFKLILYFPIFSNVYALFAEEMHGWSQKEDLM